VNNLFSIFGSSDGAQMWAGGGGGVIVRHSSLTSSWETQVGGIPSAGDFQLIFGSSDGTQLWALGNGDILHHSSLTGRWERQLPLIDFLD